jgi:hypothetical protein
MSCPGEPCSPVFSSLITSCQASLARFFGGPPGLRACLSGKHWGRRIGFCRLPSLAPNGSRNAAVKTIRGMSLFTKDLNDFWNSVTTSPTNANRGHSPPGQQVCEDFAFAGPRSDEESVTWKRQGRHFSQTGMFREVRIRFAKLRSNGRSPKAPAGYRHCGSGLNRQGIDGTIGSLGRIAKVRLNLQESIPFAFPRWRHRTCARRRCSENIRAEETIVWGSGCSITNGDARNMR